MQNIHDQFDFLLHKNLGNSIQQQQSAIICNDFSLPPAPKQLSSLTIYGTSMQQAAPYIHTLQGRLAHITNNANGEIEVMLTPDTAQHLKVKVGSTFQVVLNYAINVPVVGSPPIPVQHTTLITALVVGIGVGIIALLIGIPIAVVCVLFLSQRMLPPAELDALNSITSNPLQAMLGTIEYALAVVLAVLLTMSVSLFLAARLNILSLRRESARSIKPPLWQRLNLDIIAGVIALVGYGYSLYVTNFGALLQSDTQVLIATPLAIVSPIFLIVGCLLLFLRIFPLLLRLGALLATRGRGAISLLAFAVLLTTSVIPELTFTDLNTTLTDTQFFALQTTLATQIVIPPSLAFLLLIGGGIFLLALTMMTRVVARPVVGQALRMDVD